MTVTNSGLAQASIVLLTADRNVLGESPVWDAAAGALYWADIVNGRVHRLEIASGERAVWEFGEPVASFGLCRSGRLVIALRADVILFDPVESLRTPLASVTHGKADMRFNDGKVGPDGAFWVGSGDASGDANPVGTLYRVTAAGEVSVVTSGLRVSNGLAWDASGTRMFHSDSRGPWIDILDFDPATGEARTGEGSAIWTMPSAGPMAALSMSKAATGRRGFRRVGSIASHRMARCSNGSRCRASGQPCRVSAGTT